MSATGLVMDLGGVMGRWIPDRRLVALTELSGLPPATVDALVFESGLDDADDRGQFTPAELVETLRSVLGLDDTVSHAALRKAWASAVEPDPPVIELVARVRRAGRTTALLTNNGSLMEDALDHELAVVATAFDHLLFTWRLGATKPDRAAFDRAAERLGIDPSGLLFVDDSERNVDGARDAGWSAHRFTTVLDLTAAIRSAGLLEA